MFNINTIVLNKINFMMENKSKNQTNNKKIRNWKKILRLKILIF